MEGKDSDSDYLHGLFTRIIYKDYLPPMILIAMYPTFPSGLGLGLGLGLG